MAADTIDTPLIHLQDVGPQSPDRDGPLARKWDAPEGDVYLTGIQALVRALFMQADRDAALGLDTAGFVSGYRGSPLAGLDQQLERAPLAEHRIHFEPGLNEELAATAVWGSQQVGLKPGARHDGVFGLWYGKAPGLDRASDAIRHAHASGVARHGGVLAVVGDDHAAKSSSLPSHSELSLAHLEVPLLAPSSVQQVIDHALIGWAMSRYSGGWVGLVALADLMDGSAVVDVSPGRAAFRLPAPDLRPTGGLSIRPGHDPLALEERMRHGRRQAAIAFARANAVDRVVLDAERPRLVVLATGKALADTRQAFCDLGLDAAACRDLGVRLVQIAMPWPLDAESVRRFCRGAEKVLVVEEKRAFVETQLKEALYALPDGERPVVVGKRSHDGAVLLSDVYELDVDEIGRAIVAEWVAPERTPQMRQALAARDANGPLVRVEPTQATRKPFFCSGCPHNTSTRLPEGSRGLVGIGCHYMVQWMDREHDQVCQMGGEGAAWIGQSPFTDEKHVFANLGDGTYVHSGLLAIRAAVAADVSITYKLLFNDAVAMTGGQPAEGGLDVPRLTHQLVAEGVERVVVVAEDVDRYRALPRLASGVRLVPRSELDAVQRELREVPGVTVLVYDQVCAAEKRRRRKRGLMAKPKRRLFINEAVCEGCGDCSRASNCLSIEPVETEYGRKRRIDPSSCNMDETCLDGACPSFVSVVGGSIRANATLAIDSELVSLSGLAALPDPPEKAEPAVTDLVWTGIGGTGVTTVAALVGMASHLEGRHCSVLDMTGLAQKGGAVVSHVRIARPGEEIHGARVPGGGAHVLVAADAVVAAGGKALRLLSRERTHSVVNAHVSPTADFVRDPGARIDEHDLQRRVALASRRIDSFDATGLAERVLGDAILGHVLMLGFAWQRGLVPLQAESIERAIHVNGVAVDANLRGFRLGRLLASDPKRVEELDREAGRAEDFEHARLEDRIAHRERALTQYQDAAYARRYLALVERARALQERIDPHDERFVRAVAMGAHTLMATKDEYEVARLFTDPAFRQAVARQYEGDYRLSFHFAPPLLSRRSDGAGRPKKWSLGAWVVPLLRVLALGRHVRGSILDPLRWMPERRLDRQLLAGFEALVAAAERDANADTLDDWSALLERAQDVRGFDAVRRANAKPVLAAWGEGLRALTRES